MPQQWNSTQQIHFHFFLILNFARLYRSHRKQTNIFKDMAAFIRSKNAYQCRSHHQKRCEGRDLRVLLRQFYEDYYENRLLDRQHCLRELAHLLQRTRSAFLAHLLREGRPTTQEQLLQDFERSLGEVLAEQPASFRDGAVQTDAPLPELPSVAQWQVKPFFAREQLQLPIGQQSVCLRLFQQAEQF